ncbi:hypothetical protein [Natronoglomus mannanivorans]|uniref:Uncharacterized protein n=1 Tax=Natronoglomus mannanivorans TaxID=2979990 RepID=A0AAP3E404_9EURY|nr:hypothetical protein [Halobacteria archaeon AArc-xg1-1]
MTENFQSVSLPVPPARDDLEPAVDDVSPLTVAEMEELNLQQIDETDRLYETIIRLVSTVLIDGRSLGAYERRAKASDLLTGVESGELLSLYSDHFTRALYRWLHRDLSKTEEVIGDCYTDKKQKLGQTLTALFSKIAQSKPDDVSRYAPLLLAYLTDEPGEIGHAVVALEALPASDLSTLPADQLRTGFNASDPYVVAAVARVLSQVIKAGNDPAIVTRVNLSRLGPLLGHTDGDVSGAGAELLSEIAETEFVGTIVSDIDLSALEPALHRDEEYCSVNATAALSALVASGFETRVISELDVAVLNESLKHSNPSVIGNAAIIIGYLADTESEYGSEVADLVAYELLADHLDHSSLFVVRNAASALGYLAEYDESGEIARQVDGANLEALVRHTDADVAGNAVALINEIIDSGHARILTPAFDFGSLSAPLSHTDPFPRGNAASTPGYLAEQGEAELVIDNLDLALLDRCLRVSSERVCGVAIGSLADLVEAGYGAEVIKETDMNSLTALLRRSDAYVCGNAVLAIGHLATTGYAQRLRTHVDSTDLALCLDSSDDDVVEHTSLAMAAFAANGCEEIVLDSLDDLHTVLTHSRRQEMKGAIAAVCYCCIEAPSAIANYRNGELFDTVLSISNQIDLAYEMEIDPSRRVLRTLVARACLSMAGFEPEFTASRATSIRRLLAVNPHLEYIDRGKATTYLTEVLTVSPSETAI